MERKKWYAESGNLKPQKILERKEMAKKTSKKKNNL